MTLSPFLHPFAKPAATDFITIVRGEGAAVFDDAGKRYVDGLASLWYCNVGHGRHEIVEAVTRQMEVLENYNTFDIFTNQPAEDISALVAALSPVPDARVFLTGSGSEAVDTALKLARLTFSRGGQPQRQILVGRELAYHGVNFGGVSVQGLPLNQQGWGELLGNVAQIDHDDLGRAEALFDEHGDEIAAVIAEPVIGAGGVYPATVEYLRGLRKLCDEAGALLIFDEVITGFGRLGSWFAAEHYGVTPDLITFAKAVTSGYQPLGGVIVGPRRAPGHRGRPGLHPAPRLHLQRPSRGLRRGPGQPGRPARRSPAGSGARPGPALRRRPGRAGGRRAGGRRCAARARSGRWPCATRSAPSRCARGCWIAG